MCTGSLKGEKGDYFYNTTRSSQAFKYVIKIEAVKNNILRIHLYNYVHIQVKYWSFWIPGLLITSFVNLGSWMSHTDWRAPLGSHCCSEVGLHIWASCNLSFCQKDGRSRKSTSWWNPKGFIPHIERSSLFSFSAERLEIDRFSNLSMVWNRKQLLLFPVHPSLG